MVPETVTIKAQNQQLLSMFFLRGRFCSAKDFLLVVVLLSAILVLVTCKQCPIYEVQNLLEFEAYRFHRGDSEKPSGVFDSYVGSKSVSGQSGQKHDLENVCRSSSSFCFLSTITGFLVNENDTESEASRVLFESFSPGLSQTRSNLSWSPHHGVFRFLGGRIISCSLHQQDGFSGFPYTTGNANDDQETDVSSCINPLFDKNARSSKSGDNPETVRPGISYSLSTPPVEIRPSLMDWGRKDIFNPSLAFVTVINVDADSVLSIYDLYTSNSQFYPCNFSGILLAPGEIASICFVFFPMHIGSSSAKIVLQTSFGGFLIQARGFAVESPYLIKPLTGLDISASGRWRKNISLFNPLDEALHVEEVTAWISISSGNISQSSKSVCHIYSVEDFSDNSMLSAKDWLDVEISEADQPQVALKPHENWELGPKKTETIMEVDISDRVDGKLFAAFCLKLLRSSDNKSDTVMVPLEAELSTRIARDTGPVSVSLKALVPCDTNGSMAVGLFVRNDASYLLSIIKVTEVVDGAETFQIKSLEGLILFPGSTTQVAILNYDHMETPELNMKCKLLILVNDTRSSHIDIPCIDVISVCSERQLGSSVGNKEGLNDADYIYGRQRSFSRTMQPPSEIKALDVRVADELVLRNWKSQATVSSMSVLDEKEILFPLVLVENYTSQWIAVKNPSQNPVVMQLILNSGEVIQNCRVPDMLLRPTSSGILVGNKSIAPTRFGFSIAKGALIEAFVHPYGRATLGPILFQPSNRCEWRSSALIRNNLSGVEWLSLRGIGGSLSLELLEGDGHVSRSKFDLKLPNQLKFSFPDALHSVRGKASSCSQSLTKEFHAKNSGDLPLEVIRIEVSGAECGLDGFIVKNCKGFSLQPGESIRLQISYKTDFSKSSIKRDLQLTFASGILVIPMEASLPLYMLNLCKRSMLWIRLKKAMLVILFSLLFLLVILVFPRVPVLTFEDFKSGKNSLSSVIRRKDYLHMHFNWKNISVMSSQMSRFTRSITGEEALLVESSHTCSGCLASDKGHADPLVENLDMQDVSSSQNLSVRVGKDKGRRRRKKKNSGAGVLLFEVSSSQSGNSTPSSPLSPVTSMTTKRPLAMSPGRERSVEYRNPFSQAPFKQSDQNKQSESSSKVNFLDNGVPSRQKPSSTQKLAGRAVLLPSATCPSAGRAGAPWSCHSPFMASKSKIAPHVRAPGTKLHNQEKGRLEEKMAIEEKYTYDIWGNNLFGLHLTYQEKEVSGMPSYVIENNSESFFVRGPQTLMKNFLLPSVSSDLEANE